MWVLKLIPTLFKFKASATLDEDERDERDDGDDGDDRDDREDREDKEDKEDKENREDKAKTSQPYYPHFPYYPYYPHKFDLNQRINFSSEGCRVRHSAKIPTMGCTRGTAHCRDFLLGDAINPLSREISCQKVVDVVYLKRISPGIVHKVQPGGYYFYR